MENGPQGNIPKIRRRIVLANDAIRKQGKGMGIIPVKLPIPRHPKTPSPIRMIHKDQFTPVGIRLLERGELIRFRAVWLVS